MFTSRNRKASYHASQVGKCSRIPRGSKETKQDCSANTADIITSNVDLGGIKTMLVITNDTANIVNTTEDAPNNISSAAAHNGINPKATATPNELSETEKEKNKFKNTRSFLFECCSLLNSQSKIFSLFLYINDCILFDGLTFLQLLMISEYWYLRSIFKLLLKQM